MSNDITLVPGTTGNTGRRVTARLRLRDTPVRAASRSSRTPFDWLGCAPRTFEDFVLRATAAKAQRC
ncbi:hypothetical protein [Streptomyces sp. ICN903]|uniref:hypothetical protein n=1 Tax=Streptomyces sp. ICN903 TaxID=2964654 RepID=UPI0035B25C64